MDSKSLIVAKVLLQEIYRLGAEYIFLVPGAQIVPVLNAIYESHSAGIPKPVIANHELAAGFMAIGYSKASGKPGVAFSIGGPGAAYMVGAGITAKADDVPLILISGNVPPNSYGKGEFQDASSSGTNDLAVFREAIGNAIGCDKPEDFGNVIDAMHQSIAHSKPLHIQIPINVLKENIAYRFQTHNKTPETEKLFTNSKFPVKTLMLLGSKVLHTVDQKKLKEFVKTNAIPVVTDMKARGIISETSEESLGYVGFNSDIRALEAFNPQSSLTAETVIAIGAKKTLVEQYINNLKIEIVNVENQFINDFLRNTQFQKSDIQQRRIWLEQLKKINQPIQVTQKYKDRISYVDLLETINELASENVVYCLDSGQIRRAGSIFLTCKMPGTLLQSDTLSPMGSGICASVGAQVASPGKRVISLFGDGSMRMHGMELATAVRYKQPVIFILCDNQSYASTAKLNRKAKKLPFIDWKNYAASFGLKSFFADNKTRFSDALNQCLSSDQPTLIWAKVPYLLEDEIHKVEKVEYQNWLSKI